MKATKLFIGLLVIGIGILLIYLNLGTTNITGDATIDVDSEVDCRLTFDGECPFEKRIVCGICDREREEVYEARL